MIPKDRSISLHLIEAGKVWCSSKRYGSFTRLFPAAFYAAEQAVTHGPRRKYLEIPAARRLPVVGTKLDFIVAGAGKKLHEYIHGRHQTLGPIFRETLGPAEVVFVSSAEGIRDMFKYEGKYPKHPLPEAWTMYNSKHQCKRGLFFMDDEEWLTNRKIMNTLMMQNNNPIVNDVVRRSCVELCDRFDQLISSDSNEFVEIPNLIDFLYSWAVKGVTGIALGDRAMRDPATQDLLHEFSTSLHKLFDYSAPLMSVPPALAQRFGLKMWQRYEESASEILTMANRLVDIGLAKEKASPGSGLIAGMIKHGMSEDVIKRVFADLIIAAGDTTAFTSQWALYLLSKNVEEQEKVLGDIAANPTNLESGLVRGSIREAMRLYPVAVFIGRLFNVDGVIENYDIPKHTMVLASLFTSGRHAVNFPAPSEFQPTRWTRQKENSKYTAVDRPGASVPYALGSRSCVGQKVANVQMHYLVSTLIHRYELKLLNERDVGIDIRMITVPSEDVRIGIRKR